MIQNALNPVERQLVRVADDWAKFAADDEVRLLLWQADGDAAKLIDAFIYLQTQGEGNEPDLFVRFYEPFNDPDGYGFVLLQALRRQYAAARESLDISWQCPLPQQNDTDITALNRAANSLTASQASSLYNVVLVLTPAEITSLDAWQDWLLRLLQVNLPPNVRVVVYDSEKSPILQKLKRAEPRRVMSLAMPLDSDALVDELLANSDDGSPAARYRCHFVSLTQAAGRNDLAAANEAARLALAVAEEQDWLDQQIALLLTRGAVWLNVERPEQAVIDYQAARQLAEKLTEQQNPVGPKLQIQACMNEGAAWIKLKRYRDAATVYQSAALLAEQQNDQLIAMENWRMAGFCLENEGYKNSAIECNRKALEQWCAQSASGYRVKTDSSLSFRCWVFPAFARQ